MLLLFKCYTSSSVNWVFYMGSFEGLNFAGSFIRGFEPTTSCSSAPFKRVEVLCHPWQMSEVAITLLISQLWKNCSSHLCFYEWETLLWGDTLWSSFFSWTRGQQKRYTIAGSMDVVSSFQHLIGWRHMDEATQETHLDVKRMAVRRLL